MADLRTGIVVAVTLTKHLCRLLTTWRTKINGVVIEAIDLGLITAGQAATLNTWLDGAQAACDILRLVTGY